MVPERAIGTDQSLRYLWVVGAGNTVERRTVDLGPARGDRRAVLSGVEAGERVVVSGLSFIRFPGQPVTPMEAAAEGTPPAAPQGG
jgi:multidrug efflux system membrane fusion protein